MPRIEFNQDLCKGCGLCLSACPQRLIQLRKNRLNDKGFHPAYVEQADRCAGCGVCATICPDLVIKVWR
ncbi:MAG: 4Fe-4S binding protein [Clostridiaceae bacterium]|nr:4Fe-4S binding protein [Clostridiaceae bacterium]